MIMVSESKDGEIAARILRYFGYEVARGSSKRRGSRALRDLCDGMRKGKSIAITVDGPRGPRHEDSEICYPPSFAPSQGAQEGDAMGHVTAQPIDVLLREQRIYPPPEGFAAAILIASAIFGLYNVDTGMLRSKPTLFGMSVSYPLLTVLLYAAFGAWLALMPNSRWPLLLLPVTLFLRMAFPWMPGYAAPADAAPQSGFVRIVDTVSKLSIPFLLSAFPLYAALRRVKVYEEFVDGAKEGFEVALADAKILMSALLNAGI